MPSNSENKPDASYVTEGILVSKSKSKRGKREREGKGGGRKEKTEEDDECTIQGPHLLSSYAERKKKKTSGKRGKQSENMHPRGKAHLGRELQGGKDLLARN